MDENDITRIKAERLVNACNGLGLAAVLHWDRSPWCAKVFLTDDHDEYAPAIYFMLEDHADYQIKGHGANADAVLGWRWHSQIAIYDQEGGIGYKNEDLLDINIEILERNWLGDDEHTTASKIATLLAMLDISELKSMSV